MQSKYACLPIALLLASTGGTAQEPVPTLERDAASVAAAAIEWYAQKDDRLRSAEMTLVMSPRTNEFEISPPSARFASLHRGPPRRLGLRPEDVSRVQLHVRRAAAMCDRLEGTSLCGIPQPWVWVVVSTPAIEGDRAIVQVEARELSYGPDRSEAYREAVSYRVSLERKGGAWQVVSSVVWGIY